MDIVPEIIAQSTLLTSGLFMGYIVFGVIYMQMFELQPMQYWPYLAAIISAAATGCLLFLTKHRSKQERFYQFYLLIAAAVLSLCSGILFLYNQGIPATYLFASSHGISFVATHSYVNVRVSQKFRHFRLSLGHVWYLLGSAIAMSFMDINGPSERTEVFGYFGTAATASSTVSLVLLGLNELLHATHVYNYKQMLDPVAEKANNGHTLYLNREHTIQYLKTNHVAEEGMSLSVMPIRKRSLATFMLLLMKFKGVMLFSFLMMILAGFAGEPTFQQFSFVWIVGVVLFGAVVASALCLFIATKTIFTLASIVQVICLIAAMIVYVDVKSIPMIVVPITLYYAMLGTTYCISDIGLLDTASLLRTEISLFVGYAIEMFGIALQQYIAYYAVKNFEETTIRSSFYTHTGVYVGVSVVLVLVVAIVYPNTFGKSLLQIRDSLFGIGFVSDVDRVDDIQTVLPPTIYGYNSRTGTYDYPKTTTVNASALPLGRMQASSSSNPFAAQGLYRSASGGPAFGMNNQYSNEFRMMSPAHVIPRAFIGGAIFGSMAMNM